MAVSSIETVAVFGGTGFLGRAIVGQLAGEGLAVRAVARHRASAHQAEAGAGPGGIQPVYADVRDETSVAQAIEGCDAVVNAVGLYVEEGAETFQAVHEEGARSVARRSALSGVKRLVHLSGIGADARSRSHYVRSRAIGEELVADAFPGATILRPSVLFGPDDRFLNTFAKMLGRSPLLPLFGAGATLLQPVFVGDVALAAATALRHRSAPGKTFALGGPQVYSYRALIALVSRQVGRRPLLLPIPFAVWDLLAALLSVLPRPPLTSAQVTLMRQDNIVGEDALALRDLGIAPTPLEEVLPRYGFAGPS